MAYERRNWVPSIARLCTPGYAQLAMPYMAYGNEPSTLEVYSYLAILAVIPPWTERQAKIEKQGVREKSVAWWFSMRNICLAFWLNFSFWFWSVFRPYLAIVSQVCSNVYSMPCAQPYSCFINTIKSYQASAGKLNESRTGPAYHSPLIYERGRFWGLHSHARGAAEYSIKGCQQPQQLRARQQTE